MLRKNFLPLILALLFSCTQALAAEKIVYDNDEQAFVADFNRVADKLGNFTLQTEMESFRNEDGTSDYSVEFADDNLKGGCLISKNTDNTLRMVLILTNEENAARQAFHTGLMTLGLTEDEITEQPVFNADYTVINLWCAANQRNVKVSTAGEPGVYFVMFGEPLK